MAFHYIDIDIDIDIDVDIEKYMRLVILRITNSNTVTLIEKKPF